MLIEATIQNYRSIKGPIVFSMLAAKNSNSNDTRTVAIDKKRNLLRSAALYGANGSGKSNVIRAMAFMKRFVFTSIKMNSTDVIETNPFRLDEKSLSEPSLFEVVFYKDDKKYRYGFEVTKEKVISEWLFVDYTIKESKIFVRRGREVVFGDKSDIPKKAIDITRDNGLLLSVGDQMNSVIAGEVFSWFENLNIISNLHDGYTGVATDILKNDDDYLPKKLLLETLTKADLGVSSIHLKEEKISFGEFVRKEKIPEAFIRAMREDMNKNDDDEIEIRDVIMFHKKYNAKSEVVKPVGFSIEEESDGTKRLFSLMGPLLDTLYNNKVLFIDEIENSLHPLLFDGLIEMINSNMFPGSKSQIIFATHKTSLLDFKRIRKDQVWFTDKDQFGDTKLFSLLEYKAVRKDINLEKSYLSGIFGAVPVIEELCGE